MEADSLLNEASLKLEQSQDTLEQGSYELALGWLEMYAVTHHLFAKAVWL